MARKRNPVRPADPMEIARRRAAERLREREPGNWGADAAALRLPANADVAVEALPGGRVVRAQRQDVFETFRARGSLSPAGYAAIRRLQDDIAATAPSRRASTTAPASTARAPPMASPTTACTPASGSRRP